MAKLIAHWPTNTLHMVSNLVAVNMISQRCPHWSCKNFNLAMQSLSGTIQHVVINNHGHIQHLYDDQTYVHPGQAAFYPRLNF
jgi:hypothetical protein